MDPNSTEIVMLIDRSGSMEHLTDDTIGGVNRFIKDQKEVPGKARLTLVTFSTNYTFLHIMTPLEAFEGLNRHNYVTGGGTALLDAMGRAIDETGRQLAAFPEHRRPGKVIFVVVTDGHENSSVEYKRHQIAEKVKHQTDTYKWQFVFLGANMDAIAAARDFGIGGAQAMSWAPSSVGVRESYAAVSSNAVSYRKGMVANMAFSNEQREQAMDSGNYYIPVPDPVMPAPIDFAVPEPAPVSTEGAPVCESPPDPPTSCDP